MRAGPGLWGWRCSGDPGVAGMVLLCSSRLSRLSHLSRLSRLSHLSHLSRLSRHTVPPSQPARCLSPAAPAVPAPLPVPGAAPDAVPGCYSVSASPVPGCYSRVPPLPFPVVIPCPASPVPVDPQGKGERQPRDPAGMRLPGMGCWALQKGARFCSVVWFIVVN